MLCRVNIEYICGGKLKESPVFTGDPVIKSSKTDLFAKECLNVAVYTLAVELVLLNKCRCGT